MQVRVLVISGSADGALGRSGWLVCGGGRHQDLVRPLQILDLTLKVLDPPRVIGRGPRVLPCVDVGLLDPATQRIRADLDPCADPLHRGSGSDRPPRLLLTSLLHQRRVARSRNSCGYFLGAGMT
jgi:hypothetical protein